MIMWADNNDNIIYENDIGAIECRRVIECAINVIQMMMIIPSPKREVL